MNLSSASSDQMNLCSASSEHMTLSSHNNSSYAHSNEDDEEDATKKKRLNMHQMNFKDHNEIMINQFFSILAAPDKNIHVLSWH